MKNFESTPFPAPVFRIRTRKFLDLKDPNGNYLCGSGSFPQQAQKIIKNLDFYSFVTSQLRYWND
jgi:hypothetical protein